MFEPEYLRELIAIGQADVETRIGEIREFLGQPMPQFATV
jgi:hypothetical protein